MESRDALYEWANRPDKALPEEIGRVCTDGTIWLDRYDNEWVSTTSEQRLEIAKALLAVDGWKAHKATVTDGELVGLGFYRGEFVVERSSGEGRGRVR